jgi:peptide/nickel transport system substrate-binding protein
MNPAIFRGDYQSAIVNFMSPGEPTYMLLVSSTPGQFLSKATGYDSKAMADLLAASFAEEDKAKLKKIYSDMQHTVAADSPCTWIGFFDSANLWRDRVQAFKVSQGLTIDVRNVWLE